MGVLELARLLQARTRRRTVRLVSFGAEEQLSVGSAAYVRVHRDEVSRRGRLMYNLDSYGSHLGWLQFTSTPTRTSKPRSVRIFERRACITR